MQDAGVVYRGMAMARTGECPPEYFEAMGADPEDAQRRAAAAGVNIELAKVMAKYGFSL